MGTRQRIPTRRWAEGLANSKEVQRGPGRPTCMCKIICVVVGCHLEIKCVSPLLPGPSPCRSPPLVHPISYYMYHILFSLLYCIVLYCASSGGSWCSSWLVVALADSCWLWWILLLPEPSDCCRSLLVAPSGSWWFM